PDGNRIESRGPKKRPARPSSPFFDSKHPSFPTNPDHPGPEIHKIRDAFPFILLNTRARLSLILMKTPLTTQDLTTASSNITALVDGHLEETGGLLRLAPNWVPRSFLQPGLRIKLHPDDTYAYGLNRGGIDERWFGSTTETANEGRDSDEGLSYVIVGKHRFTLRDAIAESGAQIIGKTLWDKYGKWPVYSKFF